MIIVFFYSIFLHPISSIPIAVFKPILAIKFKKSTKDSGFKLFMRDILYDEQDGNPNLMDSGRISSLNVSNTDKLYGVL